MIQRHESRALLDARAQLSRRRAADVRNEREVAVLTQARLVDAADLDAMRTRLEDAEALSVRVGQVEQQSMTIERLYRQVTELRGQLGGRDASGAGAGSVPAQAAPPAAETAGGDAGAAAAERTAQHPVPAAGAQDDATVGAQADTTVGAQDDATVGAQADTTVGAQADTAAGSARLAAEMSTDVTGDPDVIGPVASPDEKAEYPLIEEKALADSVDISAFEAANRIVNGVPRARTGAGGKKAKAADHDDLTLIEGVGPRIQSLCYDAGITTWQEMADTTVDRLRDILAAAGPRYTGHQPHSWPEQAASLVAGERGHAMAGEARAG